jgi:hypothetical protein
MFRRPCVTLRSDLRVKGTPIEFNITIQIRLINIQNLSLFSPHVYKCAGREAEKS